MFDFIHGLREKGLAPRPETLSPESLHGKGDAGLSACAGVTSIPCWENGIMANGNGER